MLNPISVVNGHQRSAVTTIPKAQRKASPNSYLSSISFALLALLVGGCDNNTDALDRVSLGDKVYELRPLGEARPVDLTHTQLIGCDEKDKVELARCLGRIPLTNLDVKSIRVAWPQKPITAWVEVGYRDVLILIRETNGTWRVKDTLLMVR
jgi:hypothetical protein